MEPTFGGQFSSLRQKSPPKTDHHHRSISPHGNPSPMPSRQSRPHPSLTEEQLQEERRGEELRRLIHMREAELQAISQNKDRLLNKIQNTLTVQSQDNNYKPVHTHHSSSGHLTAHTHHPQHPARPLKQTGSPLRTSAFRHVQNKSRSPLRSDHSPNPKAFQFEKSAQHQSVHSNEGPNLQSLAGQVPTLSQASAAQQDYASKLFNDNQQLTKRLSLVSADLERIRRDRQVIGSKLQSVTHETENYQRVLQEGERSELQMHSDVYEIRDQNKKIEFKLHELEHTRNGTLHELNILQQDKERRMHTNEETNSDLQQKVYVLNQVNSELQHYRHQIDQNQKEISGLEQNIKTDNHQSHELAQITDQLKREREDLMIKLQQLQETYEHVHREMSHERQSIDLHNQRHTQLMSAKLLFVASQKMVQARKQAALNEFFNYCRFDSDCHRNLKVFAHVLENCGKYRMAVALKQWYQNALKPVQMIKQNQALTDKYYKHRLMQRAWQRWQLFRSMLDKQNQGKDVAVQRIWKLKQLDVSREIKRVFKMTRDRAIFMKQKKRALKKLVLRQYNNLRRQVLSLWYFYNLELDSAVRHHILQQQFSHEQLLSIALNQLRVRTRAQKAKRHMRQAHLIKAWRDSHYYRLYLMSQNIVILHFRRQIKLRLLESCFQAIRLAKENEKYDLVNNKLTKTILPAISGLNSEIEQRSYDAFKQRKLRCLCNLSANVMSRVESYFQHWRMVKVGAEHKIEKNLNEVILRLYRGFIHRAFNLWKNGDNFHVNQQQKIQIGKLTLDGKQTQSEVHQLHKQVEAEKERQSKNARIGLVRASNICLKRFKMWALRRWDARRQQLIAMEQASGVILQKLRKWLCKQAFKLYCDKVEMCKQNDRDEAKCDYYLATRANRMKRIIYNAFLKYSESFIQAKDNFGILLSNTDLWMQRRAFSKWGDKGNVKAIELKKATQNENSIKFDLLNENLGQVVKTHTQSQSVNSEFSKRLTEQAQRILSNAFARFYYIKADRGLKKWIEFCQYQKHRESLMKNQIAHLRQQKFYFVKQAFQNWIAKSKQRELKLKIDYTGMKTDEAIQMNTHLRQLHEAEVDTLSCQIADNQERTEVKAQMRNKVLEMIIRKNDDNYYMSKQRYMFYQWFKFVRRQLSFIRQIDLISRKAMWQQGFTNVRAFAEDKRVTRLQNRAAVGMYRMYQKKHCGRALAKWRQTRYELTVESTAATNATREAQVKLQQAWVDKVKDWTAQKGLDLIRRVQLKNYIRAWKNVHLWIKTTKAKTQGLHQIEGAFHARLALKKWNARANQTMKNKHNLWKYKQQKRMIYLKACFWGLKQKFYEDSELMKGLGNFAQKFDNRMKQSGFKMIWLYVKSKEARHQEQKRVAALDLASQLHQLFKRKMCSNLNTLRKKAFQLKREDMIKRAIVGQCSSKALRRFFMTWKGIIAKEVACDDVNESGPVVEEVYKEQIRLQNMKHFLKDQAYTPAEVAKVNEWAQGRQKELLARSVARLKHHSKDGSNDQYLKPKMFDRWKLFVKMRKLVRYLLRNMENKLDPRKADVSICFNRWKFGQNKQLLGVDRAHLVKMCEKNARQKANLDNLEGQAQEYMNHMAHTRDELVDNLMGSQRLAIALGRDNLEMGARKGCSQLFANAHQSKRSNLHQMLADKIDMIASLKHKIEDIEADNDSLALENEELRQFSLDGYAIAKNVKQLSNEREELSVDLSDKTEQIRKLLDQNEQLQRQLREQSEYAIQLINTSNQKLGRMQAASGRY